ncbi:hypothetical protein DSO57_1025555 [Entomophthora muscae]|uniref:Uncharacterized protein n=1 Tax=Entomophthora muscae TaxID=34485 RepID=A0ACC2S4I0_9FUNG|nr:hypothetical protein DSO57_1025555 [Entomophthora muscae]
MGHEILSHLTSISIDSHLWVDGSQLISQLLDFDVGREVIQPNLAKISEWNKQFLMLSKNQASQCFDVLFGFRNLAILSTKFACKATEISYEMEEIAVSCLKSLCYPPETVILIALAVATSVASREANTQDKRERAIHNLKELSEQPHLEYAYICLSGALLSCLDHQSLSYGASNPGSLMELIFQQSLAILERTTSTACRIQAFQVLASWMTQSSQALVGEYQHLVYFAAEVALQRLDSLLILVWTYWDDTSDSVGVAVSEMFNALLKFYNSATDNKRFTALLGKLTRDAMSFDWHRKIRYAILASLIPHQDCNTLLATHPALVKELLVAYKSSALATRATDCLSQLFLRYPADNVWLAPLGYGLSSDDPLVRRNLSTFLLPKLARIEPQLMLRLVAWLQSPPAKGRLCQHGSIAATKAAVASGVILEAGFLEKMWPCLFHADLAVRIDMLGLVSTCQKTTAAVTQAELDAVRQAFPLSANCASPDFRQKFHGHLLKLLSRLRASQAVLLRIQKPSSEARESIARQREFLGWIEGAALASLYPGASYQRVSSALKLLEALSRVPSWSIHPDTFSQLAHVLTSPYDSCRLLASSLMLGLPTLICPDTLIGWAMASLISPRAKECASGAATLDYIFQVFVIQQGRYISLGKHLLHTLPPVPAFAQELVMLLEEALDAAASSLTNASFSSPTHGLFLALQLILTTLEGEPPHVAQHLDFWKDFVQQCLAATFRMFSIGQKALLSSSPDDALLLLSEEQPNNALESVLSFCWRGVKEAAATQEILLTRLPVSLAPLRDAEGAGAALQSLMVDLRHRGAFSALMPCFRAICSRLLRSTSSAVVRDWLEGGLTKLAKADASITQRSAGLPLCMVAILNALPSPDHALLANATQQLFWLAKFGKLPPRDVSFKEFDFNEPSEDSVLPRVHGLNVLRAVFQDSGIGPQVFDGFGPLGLVVAATGLGSASWAIRNSSVLLFSTLLIRVFGIKRVRDEHDPRNSLTLREFFARFSALEPFLLQSLSAGGRAQHIPPPGLFPTLTVLARLHPTLEDNPQCHASLVAGVKSCASSPICKVRELAANAMASLTHSLQTAPTLKGLMAELSTATAPNKTHGLLLMALELVKTIPDSDTTAEVALEFSSHLDSLLSNNRTCTYRLGVVYQIWAALASLSNLLLERLKDHEGHLGFHEKLPLIDLYPSSRWLNDPDYEIREKALELLPQALFNMSSSAAEDLHSKAIALVLHPDPHLGTLIQAINCLAKQTPLFRQSFLAIKPPWLM